MFVRAAERREKFALALVKTTEKFHVLQSGIVNKRAQKAHRHVEYVADYYHYHAEYYAGDAAGEQHLYSERVGEYGRYLRARQHKSVQTGIA